MNLENCYELSKQLDEKTLAVAKKELNENPKQMASDIEAIRDWIKKENYLNSKVDDDFILAFLRTAKYSYSRAQELIRNYWVNRSEISWFHNRSFEEDSVTMEIADLGVYIMLPCVDKEGRLVMLQRIGLWDPEKHDFDEIVKYSLTCLDAVCLDPRAQVNGIAMILDMTSMGPKQATQMTPARAQKMMKCIQDAYPVRIKSINYYNYPKIFDAVLPIIKMFMKDKIKKRLKFHGSDLKSLQKEISKSGLPKEYGGDLESINKINEVWVEHLKSLKNEILDLEKYGVDLSKLPKSEKDSSVGTFRKLNVD